MKKTGIFRSRTRLGIFAGIVLGVVIGFAVGFFFGQPQTTTSYTTWSNTIGWIVWGKVHIEVSPVAYPVEGQSWTIFVYSTNSTKEGVFLTPLPNSMVEVSVNDNGQSKVYRLSVDSNGQTRFQYSPSFSDVAFQAFEGNEQSERIVVSKHYVSSDVIDTMLTVNGSLSFVTALFAVTTNRSNKIRKALSLSFVAVILLFAVISFFSFYSRFFLETPWGYPEFLIGNYVSVSILEYATVLGVALLSALAVMTIFVVMKQHD